jgi:thiamine-phosphate pyrophosphorylase
MASPLPVFALGGVTLERLPELLAAGTQGVALIAAILNAADPAAAATGILSRLEHTPAPL